jgi:branched-chain amino acid transport system substrate-binding protein
MPLRSRHCNQAKLPTLGIPGSRPGTRRRRVRRGGEDFRIGYWDPSLPYPGTREFVAAYQKEFNHAPSFLSSASYSGCQLFVEAVRRVGSLDSEKLREELLKMKTKTVFGDFVVDERGFQVGHKAITIQWQDDKPVVVWPDEVAAGKTRFPTPPWSQR